MTTIEAKKRDIKKAKVEKLRNKGILPAVLYGPKVDNMSIEISAKEFEKLYKQVGESSLVSLEIEGKEYPVLIYDIERDPITNNFIHVDFYQPILTEKVEASVPVIFEGEAPAVKELGGTLVKEVQMIEVSALPQNLPHEIRVDISQLRTFEDEILIKNLNIPEGVTIEKDAEDIVCLVMPPQKVEEELAKPVEENVEEVKSAEEKEPAEEAGEEEK